MPTVAAAAGRARRGCKAEIQRFCAVEGLPRGLASLEAK